MHYPSGRAGHQDTCLAANREGPFASQRIECHHKDDREVKILNSKCITWIPHLEALHQAVDDEDQTLRLLRRSEE